jgi:hypothetical protein
MIQEDFSGLSDIIYISAASGVGTCLYSVEESLRLADLDFIATGDLMSDIVNLSFDFRQQILGPISKTARFLCVIWPTILKALPTF